MKDEEHIGKTLEQVLPIELVEDRRYFFEKALRTRRIQQWAYPHPITVGRFMSCTITPLELNGQIEELLMCVEDIAPFSPIGELYVAVGAGSAND